MQFSASIFALAAALISSTYAQDPGMIFEEDDAYGSCGETTCLEGGCELSVVNIAGCTGVTNAFPGYVLHICQLCP